MTMEMSNSMRLMVSLMNNLHTIIYQVEFPQPAQHYLLSETMKHADKIDMRFKYTPSRLTDVAKTFARIRKQKAEDAKAEQAKPVKVVKLRRSNENAR